ncbi:hypothetical protein FA13DRAFT_1784182 [Coprinellus micaceus]|uniref:HeH/LEM domain-containing protein n=1 Tax=Coprinellus micaceus TaxID=71717 RepID=A0A4Y7TZ35_COPMI|nr:hypothetical protein FA13DRAFT_1784182 [Coprinellus micaceus]
MPRLTATEVVALGSYLEPDFDASSLTVSQLLGVLGHHGVPYPLPYSKPILVQLFVDKIVSQADTLKAQRLKFQRTMPSDEGIIDGLAGARPRRLGKKPAQKVPSHPESSLPHTRGASEANELHPMDVDNSKSLSEVGGLGAGEMDVDPKGWATPHD